MPTPIDTRLLTLTQWLSPAFPTGAFAYSHGIETAIHKGWIADENCLENWLRDCLKDGSGRADAIWLRLAHSSDDPLEIDAKARSFAVAQERLREADRQGAAFVATVNAVWDLDLLEMILPVAVGRAARLTGLDVDATVALYLQAFVTNLASAAIRLSPIGQTAGQRVIQRLQVLCLEVAEETKTVDADDVYSNAFFSDIASMVHEILEPRLFQS
ncbi:urease accessory protein UreF [Sulfitobacter sp. JL08]|uniref:urease accessory protein UreF n=1 Tax=Sulfitobacter sp. JL08 TaxID=2070369 RepID=UPI000E0A0867|nr:urease accessory protein UreF [Sulfitobacter sp. JL08]AXI57092.1 urease accessory protein UreF [Sulfitobacter sp. JL08]